MKATDDVSWTISFILFLEFTELTRNFCMQYGHNPLNWVCILPNVEVGTVTALVDANADVHAQSKVVTPPRSQIERASQ